MIFSKSDYFIISAAVVSLALSVYLWMQGESESAVFVGVWVPSILGFGSYLKRSGTGN
ncbi:hypothetical protein G3570_05900 [Balneolaceae bacterium YR4-1]|uniref:Uncharacterized protein n=1 Tax=Halalkalibaculum roseum TaxID=2709311 RepID=A0A6M1T2A0_9BACT|nr:hypothetical protein [Halalkalibaculum roseum]NGP76155.1 hypothetical protein [Halalkalibaculum roseum]